MDAMTALHPPFFHDLSPDARRQFLRGMVDAAQSAQGNRITILWHEMVDVANSLEENIKPVVSSPAKHLPIIGCARSDTTDGDTDLMLVYFTVRGQRQWSCRGVQDVGRPVERQQ
jgi:hypothetical protein